MTLDRYRRPFVLIKVNGVYSKEITERRVSWRYIDRMGKRNEATLVLADHDRLVRDTLLQPNDLFQVVWGYPTLTTRTQNVRLKKWVTNSDTGPGKVVLTLIDTGAAPRNKGNPEGDLSSELEKDYEPRNWGYVNSSQIARAIAKRHGLKARVTPSNDLDNTERVQPGNVSSYEYLRRMAEVIDFEFFIENGKLFYRKKPYNESPRMEFTYMPEDNTKEALLLSFRPTAKVVVRNVTVRKANTQHVDSPWVAQEQTAISEEAATLLGADATEAEAAVETLTQQSLPDGVSSTEALLGELGVDPRDVEANQNYADALGALGGQIDALRQAKKEQYSAKQTTGKAGLKQGSKVLGSEKSSDKKCPKDQNFDGQTPTGSQGAETGNRFDLVSETLVSGASSQASAQSSVSTTAGTDAQRERIVCATHQKRRDKAVTATAKFIGHPRMRAKVVYNFRNVGRAFSGKWYAKECVHDVQDTFVVTMKLKRGTLKKAKKNSGSGNSSSAGASGTASVTGVTRIDLVSEEIVHGPMSSEPANASFPSDTPIEYINSLNDPVVPEQEPLASVPPL